jgi:hypothetical protein
MRKRIFTVLAHVRKFYLEAQHRDLIFSC